MIYGVLLQGYFAAGDTVRPAEPAVPSEYIVLRYTVERYSVSGANVTG